MRRIDPSGTITTLAELRGTKLTWALGKLFMIGGDALSSVSASNDACPSRRGLFVIDMRLAARIAAGRPAALMVPCAFGFASLCVNL